MHCPPVFPADGLHLSLSSLLSFAHIFNLNSFTWLETRPDWRLCSSTGQAESCQLRGMDKTERPPSPTHTYALAAVSAGAPAASLALWDLPGTKQTRVTTACYQRHFIATNNLLPLFCPVPSVGFAQTYPSKNPFLSEKAQDQECPLCQLEKAINEHFRKGFSIWDWMAAGGGISVDQKYLSSHCYNSNKTGRNKFWKQAVCWRIFF